MAFPKACALEASVKVFVAYKVNLLGTSVETRTISRGKSLKITYEIECSENVSQGIWLGASFRDGKTDKLFHNTAEDRAVALEKGTKAYERILTIPKDAPVGEQMLSTSLWRGIAGDSAQSKWISGCPPIPIRIE